jgi:glycosyltransferase involved in cell wall biosynthesis
MFYKIPIVSTKIIGTIDLIDNNIHGILCDINSTECFKNSILKILEDHNLRESLVTNASKKINSQFLWDNVIKKYDKFYHSLLS